MVIAIIPASKIAFNSIFMGDLAATKKKIAQPKTKAEIILS